MGVPKFFRYISERYPCLSEVVREYQLPEFDNLYLDMNGIIHVCSHPNDTDPHFRITEEKIFKDIFHYIETLFRMIQPQKLFFMAVDGVAPRAKMNQQRGRRFRSAKEVEVAEAKAKERGEELPSAEKFDSNCITPGTEFMTRLQAQLKYFVTFKVSTDKLWQKVKVILSGHETPGEGEHKIMDYIRYLKSQPDYDANTRHCLYGLDADLIMLGLCTHEPHFALLREEVKYGKKNNQKRIPTPEETTFFLLHLSLMREYLDLEFQELKTTLSFKYDLESIIDDWILMGFLVGNDFIPHLPGLHINKGALPILYKTYTDVLPTLDGYLNEGGELKLDRFQKYMEKLAEFDMDQFKETSADLQYFEAKTGRKPGGKERHSYNNKEDLPAPPKNKALAALIASTEQMLLSDGDDDDENYTDIDTEDEDDTSFDEFTAMKQNYYKEKMEYEDVTQEVMRSQSEGYVRAIQWNLNYYYNGCCSWSWFYPHHYAPYISDIKKFSDLKLKYDLGKPFLPFQQLLAVLPSASKKLLPAAYHGLMEDDKSPIIDFYPKDFKTDLNGKRQDWEAVVLIPFIEQEMLLSAMSSKAHLLTDEEKGRNKHGPMLVYTHTPEKQGSYVAPAYFPSLANHHAKEVKVYREELYVRPEDLVKRLCPGIMLDVYFPGFPTLRHLNFTGSLQSAKVKVFESPSREDNMILKLQESSLTQDVTEIAHQILGKSVYVNWPHLFEARVVCVSSEEKRLTWIQEDDTIVSEEMNKELHARWILSEKGIRERYFERMGVEIGQTEVLVYACTLEDKKYVLKNNEMEIQKQWSRHPTAYAYQTIKLNLIVYESDMAIVKTLDQLFLKDMTVFCLYPPYYGVKGTVLEVTEDQEVKVKFEVENEPTYNKNTMKKTGPQYSSGATIAAKLGLTPHLLSRITGTIYVSPGDIQQEAETKSFKLNIGLNLKFNKRNEEVCGFTKRDKNNYWWYSAKAENEVREYIQMFPEVFDLLRSHSITENVLATDLYPEDTSNKCKILGEWLKERESNKAERQKCGAQVLEEEAVNFLENFMEIFLESIKTTTSKVDIVKPHTLYVPKPKLGQSPDPRVLFQLLDRVVSVRESHTVPLGAKGTIIGIHDEEKGPEACYDVLFDQTFVGGLKLRCSPNRGYRLPGQALINISYGLASAIKAQQFTQANATQIPDGFSPVGDEQKGRLFSPNQQGKIRNTPQQPQNGGSQQLSKEYFAMVKQLQGKSTPENFMELNHQKADQSLALKQMLKIADSSNKKLTPGPENVAFFQKTTENQDQYNVSYCMELLSLHQRHGLTLPSYEYVETNDRMVACIIKCGDGLTYQGVPDYRKDRAAENSARTALNQMQMGPLKHVLNNPPGQFNPQRRHPQQMNPPQRVGFPSTNRPTRPNANWNREPTKPHNLPQPPTNWYTHTGNIYQSDWSRSGGTRPVNPQFQPQFVTNQPGPASHQPSFNQGVSWQQPKAPFVPLQAEPRKRQPPQQQHQQRPHHQQHSTSQSDEKPLPSPNTKNTQKKNQPSRGAGRGSAQSQKSRLAINFTNPLDK